VVDAADNWSGWAVRRGSWSEVVEACGYGLAAADQLIRVQIGRRHKERWLPSTQTMAMRAVFAASEHGDPAGAVVVAERARAVLLTAAVERDRLDLDGLAAEGHSDLLLRYREAAQRFAALVAPYEQPDRAARLVGTHAATS
jgi:hypothetical protein